MAGKAPPRKPSPNGAPTLTPLGHYAGRPDIALSRQITVVGSKAGSRLHLASSTVSQSHAVIVNSASGAYIRDLASRTHVIVNGKPQREADLDDGTLLQIGKFKFQFNAGIAGAGLVEPGRSAPVGAFDPAPRAALTVEGGEMPVPVEGRTVLIGRRPTCDVPLIEDSVSTAHAIIFEMNGKRFIRDLNSRTGTFVNGERVEQVELAFGDEIRIGDTQLVYAGASGEVAEREVDELDHLMETAALPELAPDAEAEDKHGTAAGHAITAEAGESKHGEELITPVVSEPEHAHPPSEQREPEPVAPDQVRLDADPDVAAGPGDTRVLPVEKATDKPRKLPTLKARLIEGEAPEAPGTDEASVVDDALGLTPEARRREEAKAEDLGGSRRGWRGMPAEQPGVPGVVEPVAQPEDEGEAEPIAPQQVEAEPPFHVDESPVAEPEPAIAARDDDETLASPSSAELAAEAPSAPDEPVADHVVVGEEVAPTPASALPLETFEMTEDVSAPLADAEREPPEALHLPPLLEDGGDEIDVEPLPLTPEQGAPLDLTVEEPPIDIDAPTPELKLDEPVESFDAAAAAADELTVSEDAGRIEEPASLPAESAQPPAAEPAAPESPSEAPALDLEPIAEAPPADAVTEPAKKAKRKRAPRKKKGAAAAAASAPTVDAPVDASAAPESPEPERAPEPIAEATRDAVEVLDETQPTPESAQAIEDLAADVLSEPLPLDDASVVSSEASAMTDTGFGRAVDSFVGESTGPLVEPREDEAVPNTHAEPETEIELAPAPAPPASVEAEVGTSADAEAAAADELAALTLDDEPAESEAIAEAHFDAEAEAADALAEHASAEASAEATEPVRSTESAEGAEEAAAAPSIDDLLKDVLDPGDEPEVKAATASPDDTAADGQALVLEEPEVEPLAEVPEAEQPGLEPTAPAAEAPEPVESKSGPAPASPPGFGANQEHFLGGMPLKLNKPLNPAGNAASAAARAPGAGPGRGPMMPPPPPRATRPNARTRNPFDLSPGDVPAGTDLGASIPPYVGNSPKSGTITTGFDGLAMPPVRQTDVFSQMPATPAAFAAGLAGGFVDEDIFSRGVSAPGPAQPTKSSSDEPLTAKPAAPTPDRPAETMEDASNASSPASAPHDDLHEPSPADAVWADDASVPPTDDEQPVGAAAESARPARVLPTPPSFPGAPVATPDAPKRKRRWFGLRFLLLLMLLLGAAAAGGIYGLMKKQTEVVGRLRFHNVEALKTIEQQNVLKQQQQLVNDPTLRDAARAVLLQQNPAITPGFLGDAIAYERFARTADWAANARGAFQVRYAGNDPAGDDKRVRAVMLALYEANAQRAAKASGETGGSGGRSRTISETVEALSAAHTKAQQRVNDLRVQIERLNIIAQQKLDPAQLEALTAELARRDQAYTDARRKAKDVSDDVERMRQALPANPQPAGTAQAPVVDEELTKLQAELDETNEKLAAARAARAKAAEAAQASLDAALEQFQKGIAGAQDLAQDNPELAAYVTAAQKLQTSTRELTEQLIRRQQQQQQQLAELKQRLSDKMEARRADAWKKDPKLQEYGDQLAIVQRQYNAAVGGGATKEAEEFKAQVGMLEQMIKARQALIGDDAFYADAIAQLQKMIDSSQRSLEGDRRQTEAVLEEMQAAFTKSQPTVEKMSGAQKELAAALEKQLTDVNAARKQYTQAAEAAAASADDEQAKAAATVLAAKIESRRKDLSAQADKAATAEQEQARVAQLKQREQELVGAQSAEIAAQKDWEAAQKKLRDAQIAESEAREAGEKRDALVAQRVEAQDDLEKTLAQLELKQQIARSTVEPIAPTENDVQMTVHDPRPVYALASVGGIVAVFTLLALFTAGGADREAVAPIADLSPFDARPTPAPMPRMNGNGSAPQHADEDAPRVAV